MVISSCQRVNGRRRGYLDGLAGRFRSVSGDGTASVSYSSGECCCAPAPASRDFSTVQAQCLIKFRHMMAIRARVDKFEPFSAALRAQCRPISDGAGCRCRDAAVTVAK